MIRLSGLSGLLILKSAYGCRTTVSEFVAFSTSRDPDLSE